MTNVDVQGSELRIDGETVSFSNPIAEALEFDDCLVIRLKITEEEFDDLHQNVMAVDQDGSIRWKIEKAPEEGYYDSYSGMSDKEGELWTYNLSGMLYHVDLEDGSLLEGKFVK